MLAKRRYGLLLAALLASALLGCGDSEGGTDASQRDGTGPDGGATEPPEIPWLDLGGPPLELAPCPDGWREVTDDGVTTCAPYSEGGALDCPPGEGHFPGEPACAPVGSPCPVDDFSDALPTDRNVVYVQPGASGDGSSPATPYGSLGSFALGGLPVGTNIALSRGDHAGSIRLVRGIVLRGACAGTTTLSDAAATNTEGIVTLRDAPGEVVDVTLADSPRPGVLVNGASAEAVLDGVVITGTELVGVGVFVSSRLTARSLVVRETRSRSVDGRVGRGVAVERAGSAQITRAVLATNRDVGIIAAEALTTLMLTDAAVHDTQPRTSDSTGGRGLSVISTATADVSRTAFMRNLKTGVFSDGVGSAVTLSDVVIRDTEAEELGGASGRGLSLQAGARATAARVLIDANRDVGVVATGMGGALALSDVVVRDTRSQASGADGRGLGIQHGASLEANRVVLHRNREIGVFVGGEGATATLSDVTVRNTLSESTDESGGRGLGIQLGASLEANRALIDGNRDVGVFAAQPGTTVTLTDAVIRDTLPQACVDAGCPESAAGHAAVSILGASLSMTRFVAARSSLCGVQLATDGGVDLADGVVRENTIGVCLQVDGYDTDRLTNGVRFIDNGENLQATTLPIPEPVAIPGAP